MSGRKLRLGVVPYLNVEPIVDALRGDPRFELVREVPARVAERLHAGEIDLGMIPSVEYARGDYAIVPGISIASRGAVRSVLLLHERPLEELRTIAVDSSSRTSIALLQILLAEHGGRRPELVVMAPDAASMLASADAALLIGDVALYYAGPAHRFDLGSAWHALTGLPFVFAFWAGRPGALEAAELGALQAAVSQGLGRIGPLAASYNGHGAAHASENEAYLRHNIVYTFGPKEREGLREFYQRAFRLGLIPREPELRLYGDP